ncbi:MAG: ribbon-helix-helix domain-containing protein [Pseudomonadota bacterium]
MAQIEHDMDQISRSITINGRRTSIRMERSLWLALSDVAVQENCRVRDVISMVDQVRGDNGLTAALRVFVVNYLRAKAPPMSEPTHHPVAARKRMPLPNSPLILRTLDRIAAPG